MQIDNFIDTDKKSNNNKFIVYSKINITRNFKKYSFVNLLSKDKKVKLEKEIIDLLNTFRKDFDIIDIKSLGDNEKKVLLDQNIVEEDLSQVKEGKILRLKDDNISILLNYNDHINLSIVSPKLSFNKDFEVIERLENMIGKYSPFVASTKYGYLTSHVKNCGLAMRLSVLVHLPGLSLLKKKKEVFKIFSRRKYSIKPWKYTENSEDSKYFIVSSKINFGVSEKHLIKRFMMGINDLLEKEKSALHEYSNGNKENIVDTVFRSYGILKYSKKMDYSEALEHLSNLRMGLELGEEIDISEDILSKLFIQIKESFVVEFAEERSIGNNVARSIIIQSLLNKGEDNV